MKNQWWAEIQRVAGLVIASIVAGFFTDDIWRGLFIGLFIYSAFMLWQFKRIHDWLQNEEDTDPPECSGILGYISDRIYRLQRSQLRERQQLEADVEYLRASFTSLSDAVVMINRKGKIDWCNPAAVRFLGLRLPDDLNHPIVNLLRDPAFISFYEKEGAAEPIIIPAPMDAERSLYVQKSLFGKGNVLLFVRDITEMIKLEQMRKDFVSNVSHELRTPLTVLMGYVDNFYLFVDQLPALKKPLDQMQQNARRMENLLHDLLLLSRLETQLNDTHKSQIALEKLAAVVIEEARASLPPTQTRTFSLKAQGSFVVYGQPTELHSAVSNLVTNACKYTDDNGVINVCITQDENGIHFSVSDNGMGIDPLEVPRITERFYRADRSRSVNTGGTGLGLAIVKRILQRHEATLTINSALGKGSEFCCHFPPHRVVNSHDII